MIECGPIVIFMKGRFL